MAVPKRKTSKSRKGMRRSHHALKTVNIGFDATTGEVKLSHRMSLDGYYNGKEILKARVKPQDESEESSEKQ